MRHEISRSRSARLNRVLCILLHSASRIREAKKIGLWAEYQELFRQGTAISDKSSDDYESTILTLLGLPFLDRGDSDIFSPESESERGYDVQRGLMIVKKVNWIGEARVGNNKSYHLARVVQGTRSIIAVGEYDEFVPCVGQEEPELLRELKDRVDFDSLRIRQKDWKWY
jgi:hypothetical protein